MVLGREEGVVLGREEGVVLGREEGVVLGREEGVVLGREEGVVFGNTCMLGSMCPINYSDAGKIAMPKSTSDGLKKIIWGMAYMDTLRNIMSCADW